METGFASKQRKAGIMRAGLWAGMALLAAACRAQAPDHPAPGTAGREPCMGVAGMQRTVALARGSYLEASNTDAYDWFGFSVALSGDTLAVGALGEDSAATGVSGDQSNNRAQWSGAVYVFRRTGDTWTQEAYIKPSNTGMEDGFGRSMALDGDTLVVGAYLEDSAATGVDGEQADDSATNSGAAYVFRRTDGTWSQEAYLKASDTDPHDWFGYDVALSGDTVAVGALYENSVSTGVGGEQTNDRALNSGAVYVFRRTGRTWAQEAYIKASNTNAYDWFGERVALSGDTLAVGAPGEDSAATGVGGDQADDSAWNSGAAYVFRRTGRTWEQEAYIKASNTRTRDAFGRSIALSGDTLAVGAPSADSTAGRRIDDAIPNSGAAYVFRRTGRTWAQEAQLAAPRPGAEDMFGQSIALRGDTLAAGAPGEDSALTRVSAQADDCVPNSGAVHVFQRRDDTWTRQARLEPLVAPRARNLFGLSVALDEGTLAVGAPRKDAAAPGVSGGQPGAGIPNSGAVYVFHIPGAVDVAAAVALAAAAALADTPLPCTPTSNPSETSMQPWTGAMPRPWSRCTHPMWRSPTRSFPRSRARRHAACGACCARAPRISRWRRAGSRPMIPRAKRTGRRATPSPRPAARS